MLTIKCGPISEAQRPAAQFSTVRSVLTDAGLRAQLGYGDNASATVNGVPADEAQRLASGDTVVVSAITSDKG